MLAECALKTFLRMLSVRLKSRMSFETSLDSKQVSTRNKFLSKTTNVFPLDINPPWQQSVLPLDVSVIQQPLLPPGCVCYNL
jgi:hypothetical protein